MYTKSEKKRQILDHYLEGICNITSYYEIFTIEILSRKLNHPTHQIESDGKDIELSKVFSDSIKKNTTPKFTKSKINFHE